jgi:magnesium chelatase family protein
LATNGVLFLDELTEFKRDVLEFLRQPLEDGYVTVSRTRQTVQYPARFMLVASTNPCPCGYYGDPTQPCTCSPNQRDRYWAKLSGPLMDRIDLHVTVGRLRPEEIVGHQEGEPSGHVLARVTAARARQQQRFANEDIRCNAQMQGRHLREHCRLDKPTQDLLEGAIRRLGLSARASDRVLKVARTIADLAGAAALTTSHVAEAIQYRSLDRIG